MGYIEELRALVGHRPLILVGTSILLVDGSGHVLLLRRADNSEWNLPGGYMELGESVEDTARRELREEIGLEVRQLSFFGLLSGRDFFYEYPNGDQVFSVAVVYVAREWQGYPRSDSTEVREVRFFDLHALPRPLGRGAEIILKQYLGDEATGQ